MFDVVVIGGGPAGLEAARRAAELGAKTALVTRDYVGGMAANDGPVPVRTLAYAARLIREARQLEEYGITSAPPQVDYDRLLRRVNAVVMRLHDRLALVERLQKAGASVFELAGLARFAGLHAIETDSGLVLEARKFIICAGGRSRELPIPGFEYCATHSDAWSLKSIPSSMIVVGSGATGVQVASIFNAFGSKVTLLEIAPHILMTEDEDVSAAVKQAFVADGIDVVEGIEAIDSIERRNKHVRLNYRYRGQSIHKDASMVVMTVGWVANAKELNLSAANVQTDARGYVAVNEFLQTNVSHIFAAGDINGRWMLAPIGVQEGYYAACNAVLGLNYPLHYDLIPTGSFTNPEYAQIGMTESRAGQMHDIAVATVDFGHFPRSIIDGRTEGFCKIIADRTNHKILGCHIVGERAVETVQLVAAGMKVGLTVEQLADIPLSFPTYVAIVGQAAFDLSRQLGLENKSPGWAAHHVRLG